MENNHLSPTNNANMSKDDLISDNHINELPISAVYSNKNSNGDRIMSAEEIEAFMNSFPPGFRFNPTDIELIIHYLMRKIDNLPLQPNKIYEMNIYKYSPDAIAEHVKPTTGEKAWYIFTSRDRKYRKGSRPSRAAGDGYWKATGADKGIKDDNNNNIIGFKKALVYYTGRPPKGEKTDWIMHEFRLPRIPHISKRHDQDMKLDKWVLCRIYNRNDKDKSMFTQRKRSRENHELIIDEVNDTFDGHGQVHESPNENLSNHESHGTFFEAADDQDSTRNDPTNFNSHPTIFFEGTNLEYYSTQNYPTNYNNNNNHATTFHPQVSSGFCTFPQRAYNMPIFCNYQSCVPNHQIAPSPMMIEPISSMNATTNSIEHDHTMNNEGFGIPFFGSCIGGGSGEYLIHDQDDPIAQYLVDNNEIDTISSEYNFVNGNESGN